MQRSDIKSSSGVFCNIVFLSVLFLKEDHLSETLSIVVAFVVIFLAPSGISCIFYSSLSIYQ